MEFIDDIARYVKKYAPQYGIKIYSPILAQAILESASGTSELARVHNYFGLKYHAEVSQQYYIKNATEQNPDGSYRVVEGTKWCKFDSMEEGVEGYFKFLFGRKGVTRYDNLKTCTTPYGYLLEIKAAGYATSLSYVDNLMAVIDRYNLTAYDNGTDPKGMIINVHAGHAKEGATACGAVGILNESRENRIVKDLVIKYLKEQGHTVYDCTVETGINAADVLTQIVEKCNAHTVDLDVSIHFNAAENKSANGTEVWVYSASSKALNIAKDTVNAIGELGFKNRGIKFSTTLSFLKRTKAPAMLIECCFVNGTDPDIYDADKMARKIVKGITGNEPQTEDKNYIVCPHCGQKIEV